MVADYLLFCTFVLNYYYEKGLFLHNNRTRSTAYRA